MISTDTFTTKESGTTPVPMKAATLVKPGTFQIREFPLPEPGAGEVRIRLQGTGVCASNTPVWEGREWFTYPVDPGAPGHEGWGFIDALGDNVQGLKVGDRVCCLSYHAYATYDLAQAQHVMRIPERLDDIPFPGEPLGCAMNIFDRSDIREGQTVAIVGMGFLGSLLCQLCKSAGATVIAISRREYALEVAKESGADIAIAMDDHWRIIEEVKKATEGKLCERVIEATGKEWPLNLAIELTGERGRLIVAGFHQDGMRSVNMQTLNWRGIDMINAHERDAMEYIKGMQKAVVAITEGKMKPQNFYTHFFGLENIEDAFESLSNRPTGFMKAIIQY